MTDATQELRDLGEVKQVPTWEAWCRHPDHPESRFWLGSWTTEESARDRLAAHLDAKHAVKATDIPIDHGFQWIGQSWEHCERCSRPVSEHPGIAMTKKGASPFGVNREEEIVPFEEAARRMPLAKHYGLLVAAGVTEGGLQGSTLRGESDGYTPNGQQLERGLGAEVSRPGGRGCGA